MAIVNSYQTAEYGKFIQLDNSSYPAVSVTRIGYYDSSSAFPGNTGSPTYSAIDVYPKYAVLTQLTNPGDISVSLSAGSIDVNVADIEKLVTRSNTLLEVVTGQSSGGSIPDSKIDSLTADVAALKTLVSVLTGQTNRINGFVIPDYNRVTNTYYGTSNNVSQVDYKFNNTVVASLSFTYVTPTSADSALLAEVIKIL